MNPAQAGGNAPSAAPGSARAPSLPAGKQTTSAVGRPSILISGIGIAGPALAYWLLRSGFAPTLVERAPSCRREGYIIDFWGAGYDIVEKMGILPDVLRAGYCVREVRLVDDRGRRAGGFAVEALRSATRGRFTSLPRGALSAVLYGAVAPQVETMFGDSVAALEGDASGVMARFEHHAPRRFDCVIGADGLHSAVRQLAFGPEAEFEKFLGYRVAAFEASGYRPHDENVYVAYNVPGRQIARFSLRDDRTMFLFVIADEGGAPEAHDAAGQKDYLRRCLGGMQWEAPQILEALDRCGDLYFDRVSQIRMDRWSRGRIALVGDAAFAPSLLAGQGAALAIIGAYVLAGELPRAARVEDAFARYETMLRGFMADKQAAADGFARFFAPKTSLGIFLRNQLTKTFALPFVAKLAFGSGLLDHIELPEYAEA